MRMNRRLFSVATGMLALAACETQPKPAVTSAKTPAASQPDTPAHAAVAPQTAAAGSNAEPVRIWTRGPGLFAVQNTTSQPIQVVRDAVIEAQDANGNDVARPHDGVPGYQLSFICPEEDDTDQAKPPGRCVTLKPGEILEPKPYRGTSCDLQCTQSCRANAWEGPSTMRLRVSTCDGSASFVSPSFDLPASPEGFLRVQVASNLTTGEAWRLLPTPHAALKAKPVSGTLAGFAQRPESRVALSESDVRELKEWISAPKGFDDQIRKRCGPSKHYVGFRMVRSGPESLPNDTSDVVIDFTCNAMFISTGVGGPRHVLTTYFDPSRASMLRFAKRLFPQDPELWALKEK